MQWSSQLNRIIVTLGQIASAAGAYIIASDAVPFGLDAHDAGLTLVWIGVFSTIISTALRANWIPGATTGVGAE